MSSNDKVAATFHPHPSYTAMEAAWDPERREQARTGETVIDNRPIKHEDQPKPPPTPTWAGNIAKQRRPRK